MASADPESCPSSSRTSSVSVAGQSSWETPETPPELVKHSGTVIPEAIPGDAELTENELEQLAAGEGEGWDELDGIATLGLGLKADEGDLDRAPVSHPEFTLDDLARATDRLQSVSVKPRGPFHKWMRTLHRRASQRPRLGTDGNLPWQLLDSRDRAMLSRRLGHKKSWSGSSLEFVTRVKSASISLASVSGVANSRRNMVHSRVGSKTDRSSRASLTGPRASEDGCLSHPEAPIPVDPAATERALQRRRILEELITTEESYIGDVRFLMNVYITLLASLPTLSVGLRASINRNLTEMVELHEEILGELHRVVPNSEYTQLEFVADSTNHNHNHTSRGHQRWRSLDSVPEDDDRMSWLQEVPGMVSDPQVAEEVAKVFGKKMNRFFIYKEYGAKYEMMIKDVALAPRSMPQWETYHKGFEALASSLGSANSQMDQNRKSLSIGDLLVKPIQRVCKYPLLFAELLKYTPVNDCPNSHMEVENALIRLREATAEINRATDDVRMKSTLEKTWMLQDRLVFANQRLDAASKNRIRSFGHIQLCGALHVCWATKDDINGQYMICLLYRDVLCLASAGKVEQVYTVQACISLGSATVEEVDNGRGLQCHTAPFSWKLVFECDYHLYEIIMTACTPKEEVEWRSRLTSMTKDGRDQRDVNLHSSLSLEIKSLGSIFGKPGTMARRLSIQRATTIGLKTGLCQVILKNTCVVKDAPASGSTTSINRSQSFATSHRIPVLAPPRAERARVEALLSDVWSRDVLPFPGMTTRSRSEHLVRSSASSMMRKLSVASITSSFSRRSGSFASVRQPPDEGAVEEEESDAEETGLSMSIPKKGAKVENMATKPADGDVEDLGDSALLDVRVEPKKEQVSIEPENASENENENETETGTVRRKEPRARPAVEPEIASTTPLTVVKSKSSSRSGPASSAAKKPDLETQRNMSPRTEPRSITLAPSKHCTASPEKENCHVAKTPTKPGVVRRVSNKWKASRPNVLNKGVVSQGIRGIFR